MSKFLPMVRMLVNEMRHSWRLKKREGKPFWGSLWSPKHDIECKQGDFFWAEKGEPDRRSGRAAGWLNQAAFARRVGATVAARRALHYAVMANRSRP